jgi:hypothetical protein
MWIKEAIKKPVTAQIYNVFGFVKNDKDQGAEQYFLAYFNFESQKWEDPFFDNKELDADKDVQFWFDFELIKKPI